MPIRVQMQLQERRTRLGACLGEQHWTAHQRSYETSYASVPDPGQVMRAAGVERGGRVRCNLISLETNMEIAHGGEGKMEKAC